MYGGNRREECGRCRRILFSNGVKGGRLFVVDALGCLCSLRARLALDGVSWVQGGSVEIAVGQSQAACNRIRAVVCSLLRRRSSWSWMRPPVSWLVGSNTKGHSG